jgi:hypothetical protein
MMTSHFWTARKPEDASTSSYDQKEINEEVFLEADDTTPTADAQNSETAGTESSADPARVASPSVLLEPAADLSLDGPSTTLQDRSTESVLSATAESSSASKSSTRNVDSLQSERQEVILATKSKEEDIGSGLKEMEKTDIGN